MQIRNFQPDDEPSWLRCRALSFLGTDYYDDVRVARTIADPFAVSLVAVDEGSVAGILDVARAGALATIDTIAVHPDVQRRGLATQLLTAATIRMARDVTEMEAWTRDDAPANNWYLKSGFSERYRYLHVYKSPDEGPGGFASPAGLSTPVSAFAHAPIELEADLRQQFRRIHVCRRYLLPLRR